MLPLKGIRTLSWILLPVASSLVCDRRCKGDNFKTRGLNLVIKRFLTENMVIYIRFDLKATFKPGLIELLKANCNINVTDKAFISENTFC